MQIAKITIYKGKGIFEGCVNLRVVDIGNFSVVPDSTFKDCKALEEVKQPVGNIYNEAFFGCISLKRIILSQIVVILKFLKKQKQNNIIWERFWIGMNVQERCMNAAEGK